VAKILISGLVNVETTLKIRQFPIEYYPIDYPFFGINTAVSGVAYNISGALTALGDSVCLLSMTGRDFQASYIRNVLKDKGISSEFLLPVLSQTPSSVILYEDSGRRQVWCDLKDIQETAYPFREEMLSDVDLVAACNINFNRPLLDMAKRAGKTVATDVHVLSDICDGYNLDFLRNADILFLSDEAIGENFQSFLQSIASTYGTKIIVLGRGSKGAALCMDGYITCLPAVQVGPIVNTVGAGDALFSGFLHYYAGGMEPLEALKRAQLFASAKIGSNGGGAGFVSEKQIEEYYRCFAADMKPF